MHMGKLTQPLLLILALALVLFAGRPYTHVSAVKAQSADSGPWYFEPGVRMLRIPEGGQVQGKVAVDLRTGNIWGFPTYGDLPYPVPQSIGGKIPTSHPFLLGRFAVEETNR